MRSQVNKWGGSLGVRIPRKLAEVAGIAEGSPVNVTLREGVITIERPKHTLEELVAGITPDNRHPETDWGPPVGNEL